MQILQRGDDFRRIKPRVFLWQALARSCLKGTKEFTTHTVLHAKVQILFGLEGVKERDDEGMIGSRQDFLLRGQRAQSKRTRTCTR